MARFCVKCGKKLGFFAGGTLCKECKAAQEAEIALKEAELYAELEKVLKEITDSRDITEGQIALLKGKDKESLIGLYSEVYDAFEADKELDETEINTLKKIQDAFDLSNDDVDFDELVRPYIYVSSVKKDGTLPTVNLRIEGGSPVILKKGEIVHFADSAVLKEMRSVSLGYSGGSHGVSFPIGGGIRYRVGGYRGFLSMFRKRY
jgi:hypothetical protein